MTERRQCPKPPHGRHQPTFGLDTLRALEQTLVLPFPSSLHLDDWWFSIADIMPNEARYNANTYRNGLVVSQEYSGRLQEPAKTSAIAGLFLISSQITAYDALAALGRSLPENNIVDWQPAYACFCQFLDFDDYAAIKSLLLSKPESELDVADWLLDAANNPQRNSYLSNVLDALIRGEITPEAIKHYPYQPPDVCWTTTIVNNIARAVAATRDNCHRTVTQGNSEEMSEFIQIFEKYVEAGIPFTAVGALCGLQNANAYLTAYRHARALPGLDQWAGQLKQTALSTYPEQIIDPNSLTVAMDAESLSPVDLKDLRPHAAHLDQKGKTFALQAAIPGVIPPIQVAEISFDSNTPLRASYSLLINNVTLRVTVNLKEGALDWNLLDSPDAEEMALFKQVALISLAQALELVYQTSGKCGSTMSLADKVATLHASKAPARVIWSVPAELIAHNQPKGGKLASRPEPTPSKKKGGNPPPATRGLQMDVPSADDRAFKDVNNRNDVFRAIAQIEGKRGRLEKLGGGFWSYVPSSGINFRVIFQEVHTETGTTLVAVAAGTHDQMRDQHYYVNKVS